MQKVRNLWRRTWRQVGLLLLLAAIPSAISAAVQLQKVTEPPLAAGEVRLKTAQGWGAKVLWVDAREQKRFDAEHIPEAIRLTADEWETLVPAFLDRWDDEKLVVVYCDGGGCEASHAVAAKLEAELQIKDVFVLQGGFPAWQKAHP